MDKQEPDTELHEFDDDNAVVVDDAIPTRQDRLTGTEFQKLCGDRGREYSAIGSASMALCGVQAVRTKGEWRIIPSRPDFEGALASGRQFVFDCKVCSQASFDLSAYRDDVKGSRARQLRFVMERSRMNVPCFFLLHWNARELSRSSQPAETYVFPVRRNCGFWRRFEAAEVKSITRNDCRDVGYVVEWNVLGRARTLRPDFLSVIEKHLL